MHISFLKLSTLILILGFSTIALAKPEPSKINFSQAAKAMQAAEAYANEKNWKVTILITDQNGVPIMLHRQDGALLRSIDFVNGKALVVAQTGLSSGDYAEKVKAGKIKEIDGGVKYKGGVPVYIDGEMIGAVMVSGVKDYEDEEIAIAGVEAISGSSHER